MLIEEDLTRRVIGCAYRVYNVLGSGLPESVYVGALEHECEKNGMLAQREFPIAVYYDGVIVGSYRADLLIDRRLIIEDLDSAKSRRESPEAPLGRKDHHRADTRDGVRQYQRRIAE